MFKENFYSIIQKEDRDGELLYRIKLNSDHAIYKGHFPGLPVTPGVCQLAIVKECLEESLGKSLFLKSSKDIKFARLNNPDDNDKLLVRINFSRQENDVYKVNATIVDDKENVILKLRGEFSDRL